MGPAKRTLRKTKAEISSSMESQRLDRWLWHARVVRTRAIAASLIFSRHVRVNGKRAEVSGHVVQKNDVLTIALPSRIRVLRVIDFAYRRGKAAQAERLYEEINATLSSN
jgi:ribosome-associated heat shock protein Hsp15